MRIVLNNSKLVFAEFKFVPDHENTVVHPNMSVNFVSNVLTGLTLIEGHKYKIVAKSEQAFTMQTSDNVRFMQGESVSAVSVVSPSISNLFPSDVEIVPNQEYTIEVTAKKGVDLTDLRLGLYSKGAVGCTIYMAIKDITG